jgi:hypothetical protein
MTLMKAKLAHDQEKTMVRRKNTPNCNSSQRQKPPKQNEKMCNFGQKKTHLDEKLEVAEQ